MTETEKHPKGATKASERPIRADARRNEDAILKAARDVFMTTGVNAPVREITTQAGVGLGTLYRRFPKRSDLIAAVFSREIDDCADAAPELAKKHPPAEAVAQWLRRYAKFMVTKKGLAAALHSGDPAFDALPDYFRSRFEPALAALLSSAAITGEMRDDITPYDLLRAIGNLSAASGADGAEHVQRMVDLMIDGFRKA